MRTYYATGVVLMLALASPAAATSTRCSFESTDPRVSFDLDFFGYGEVPMIQANVAEGPRNLPAGSYDVIEFDSVAAKVHVTFRNPGDSSLPPSFVLRGSGQDTRISISSHEIPGELNCDY